MTLPLGPISVEEEVSAGGGLPAFKLNSVLNCLSIPYRLCDLEQIISLSHCF